MPLKCQKNDVYFCRVLSICKQWGVAVYQLYPDCVLITPGGLLTVPGCVLTVTGCSDAICTRLFADCTCTRRLTDRACCRRVAAISSTTALRWPTPTAKWSRTRSTESRTKLTSSSPTPPSRVCTLFMCVSGSCVARLRLTVRQLSHWPIHVNGSLVVTSRLKQHDMW